MNYSFLKNIIAFSILFKALFCNADNFSIVSQTDSSIEVQFTLPGYDLSPKDSVFDISTIGSYFVEQAGLPRVPKFVCPLQLNSQSETSVSIVDSSVQVFNGIYINLSDGERKYGQLPTPVKKSKLKVNGYFPFQTVNSSRTYTFGTSYGTSVQVFPFKNNRETGELMVYKSIKFRITFNRNRYKGVNNSLLTNTHFKNPTVSMLKSTASSGEQGSMLVVCPVDFLDELNPLVSWKNQKGVKTEMVTYESIVGKNSLKQYIDDYYKENVNTYLLLVGDSSRIPQLN